MSVLTTPRLDPGPDMPPRKRWNRTEAHFLWENNLLGTDKKYELIDGDLLEKMGQKQPHPKIVMRWLFALAGVFGAEFLLCQLPIVLSEHSEPEPDIAVLSRSVEDYSNNPPATDVRLLIEVSVSTLGYDKGQKAQLYAAAGIADYWVSDVASRVLLVHRDPTPDNGYATILTLTENETIAPLAVPDTAFRVGDFLP